MAALNRRRLLQLIGWGSLGLTVGVSGNARAFPVLPHRGAPEAEDAAAWISLRPDGQYELYSPRVEIGQGIARGLCQIAADELDCPVGQIVCLPPDTGRLTPVRATVGSDSIKDYGLPMAQAAAALALLLRGRAADRWGLPVERLSLDGALVRGPGGRHLSLSALAVEGPLAADEERVSAARPRFGSPGYRPRAVGQALPTEGIEALVTGNAPLFADDVRLPGMVFGAVLRSERLEGALDAVDDKAARDIPGYLGMVRDGDLVGLLATRRGALAKARAAVERRETGGETVSGKELMARLDVDAALAEGDLEHRILDDVMADDARFDIDLHLDVPFAAHAAMEPRTAVARFDAEGRLEIWSGTQDVFLARDHVANELGLDSDKVVLHGRRVGGGFGGKAVPLVELEAARLARAAGRPVKLQWSRRDEFAAAFHRPPSRHRIRARLDAEGRIEAWWHAFRSGHVIFTSAGLGPFLQFATSFVADPGAARGAVPPYAAAQTRVEFDDVRLPVKTGPWRGLGALPNCWAIETAVDALARHRREDPLAFRRRTLSPRHPRLRRVLEAVARTASWPSRRSDGHRAYGLACGIYKEMAYAAVIAEVALDGGSPRVTRLWCAQDCGLVINPDQVRAQVEGNLVWGLSSALYEELEVEEGRITAESYADYALARFSDVPDINIELIEGSTRPTGAGESAIVAASAAITNAIAAGTGRLVTGLPYRS